MNLAPGFTCGAAASGIKNEGLDMGCLVADGPVAWAGVFTRNAAAAAPVVWCRSLLGEKVRAVVVNSGNANACTGPAGRQLVSDVATLAADRLRCSSKEVLVASTGPIGVALDLSPFVAALPVALDSRQIDVEGFARSILTTDTRTKTASVSVDGVTISGVAKGAAMIAPNMATMLAFITSDAALPQDVLEAALARSVDQTFNRISVDACESTNDSVFLLSSQRRSIDAERFEDALRSVCVSLAEQIVTDAEGATKLLRITVCGAQDENAAVAMGKAVAASDLWRAAAAGCDPNWGRVLAAAGSTGSSFDLSTIELSIGPALVFSAGRPAGSLDVAAKAMAGSEVLVELDLCSGPASATVLAADLTTDYVKLNSEVTT